MRKAGVTKAMTPMAERQRSVDRVRDSRVGGMCYGESRRERDTNRRHKMKISTSMLHFCMSQHTETGTLFELKPCNSPYTSAEH